MNRLREGFLKFKAEVYPEKRDLFQKLACQQNPHTLFITCADSRIVPHLITQSDPGDLFVSRNAGNMVPPYSEAQGGVAATIDYAVTVLKVQDVVICGHSNCGAMKAILHPEVLDTLPSVKNWMAHGALASQVVKENYPDLEGSALLNALTEENVVAQLLHLRTFPSVAARLARGKIQLHGWVYDIAEGKIRVWNPDTLKFVSIEDYDSDTSAEGQRVMAVS